LSLSCHAFYPFPICFFFFVSPFDFSSSSLVFSLSSKHKKQIRRCLRRVVRLVHMLFTGPTQRTAPSGMLNSTFLLPPKFFTNILPPNFFPTRTRICVAASLHIRPPCPALRRHAPKRTLMSPRERVNRHV
jgi:hypothetical protein